MNEGLDEVLFARKVRQHLNGGLRELGGETNARLAAARAHALAHQKSAVSQSVLAAAGGFVQHSFASFGLKQLFVSLVLLAGVVSSTFWFADQRVSELGAIDSALLANDLPIAAFTDKGFDTWLQSASSD